jgi:RNA polymerase sigma-70 factor (ECF subfamily)
MTASSASLDEHLFRRESARMVAALTRVFGVHNLALAEDVVQDAFERAAALWASRGVPDNPGAWLMQTARNRAIDVIRRERTARTFAPELVRMRDESPLEPIVDEAFAAPAIKDGELRMMFSCCHPSVPEDAQVALVLNILCGFGAAEIAAAFLASRAAIEKRIARGKKALAAAKTLFDLADADFAARLGAVRRALYLLFSEGYHGASAEAAVRTELCEEAMRLVALLREHAPADTPETCALAALMSLHAARLPARVDAGGELSAFADQDRSRWDRARLEQGLALFEQSARGDAVSAVHVEAAIAVAHASAASVDATDWAAIVALYDRLLAIAPSAVVALNRAIAIGERDGAAAGLAALDGLSADDRARLAIYPFYPAALGELSLKQGDRGTARAHFTRALALARNHAERHFLTRRLHAC